MAKEIRSRQGHLIARVESDGKVRSATGELLGSIRNGNTYGPSGTLVCEGEAPGLLIR